MDHRIPATLATVLLSGCAWITLAPEAKDVRVLESEAQAQACQRMGQTTVSLLDRLAGIPRNPEQVRSELITLARNSAARDLGGNAILPVSEVEEGRQIFVVFRCPR